MALDCSPEALNAELDAAQKNADQPLRKYREMVREYETSMEGEDKGGKTCPDNPMYEYVGIFVPGVSSNNPRVTAKSRRPMLNAQDARILGYAVNDWCEDTRYVQHAQLMAYDMAFLFGASVVRQAKEPRQGYEDGPSRPRVEYIPPARFMIDPSAHHWLTARWTAHASFWDINDLKELSSEGEGGWNADAIAALGEDSKIQETRELGGQYQDVPARGEVVLWEMFVPEHELEESEGTENGYNGTIFTVCQSKLGGKKGETRKFDWVRNPRPFYGPKKGPHTVYGAYWTPGSPIPLSPLRATRQQALEQQAHARAISMSSLNYKRVVFVDSSNSELIQRLKDAPHDFVYPCTMGNKNEIQVVEMGGVTDQMLKHYGISRERFDRMLAMHDAQRGIVTGDGTARENMIAAESTATRVAYLKRQFNLSAKEELTTVAWYIKNDEDSEQRIRPGRGRGMATRGGVYKGGKDENEKRLDKELKKRGQEPLGFDDLDIDISPLSMEYTSEQAAQDAAIKETMVLGQIAPLVMQFPFVRWHDQLARIGDAFNNPMFADMIDYEMAEKMGLQMAAQMGQQQTQKQQGQTPQRGQAPVSQAIAGLLPQAQNGGMPSRAAPSMPNPIAQPMQNSMPKR